VRFSLVARISLLSELERAIALKSSKDLSSDIAPKISVGETI
jgi:hypothetical protein